MAIGALAGAAFLTKWLVVGMVLPALFAAYLGGGSPGRPRTIPAMMVRGRRFLGVAGGAGILVAGWWPLLVTLTPAASRPHLDGTGSNSVADLVFGRNGFARIGTRAATGLFGGTPPPGGWDPVSGTPGPGRLLNQPFSTQIG